MPQQVVMAPGAAVESGMLALDAPIDVHVAVATPDGGSLDGLFVGAAMPQQPRRFGMVPQAATSGGITLRSVPCGTYELLVWGETIAPQFATAVLMAERRQVPVVAGRGTATRFTWAARGPAMITLRRDGAEFLEVQLNSSQPTLGLEPGRYSIDVAADRMRGSAEFVVGATPGAPVDVPLAK